MSETYPKAPKGNFRETLHGRELSDPYHWLAGAEEGETARWMAEEQALSDRFFARSGNETRIRAWLAAFMAKPFVFHAFDAWRFRFLLEEVPDNEQPRLVRIDRASGERRVAVDPAALERDGREAILDQESIAASPDGRHVAFSLKNPEGQMALHVRDIESGSLEENAFPLNVIPRVSWHPRGHGFFYNQCQGEFIPAELRSGRPDGVYWHALGTAIAEDRLVHPMDWPPAHGAVPAVSDDGRFLFVNQIRLVANVSRLTAIPLAEEGTPSGAPVTLAPDGEGTYCYVGLANVLHLFETDLGAPNGRIIGFDLSATPRLHEVVGEQQQPLSISPRAVRPERSAVVDGRLVVTYLDGAAHRLRAFDLEHKHFHDLRLPPGSAIAGAGGDRFGRLTPAGEQGRLIVDLWRHTAPPVSCVYDLATDTLAPTLVESVPNTLSPVRTEEVRYAAKDGTLVPMTILSLAELPLDGVRPCLLYGYGGWGMPIVPEYSHDIAAWLALGGVYVVANIRGGGEYGERWHEAGKGANKQTVFDDFIAAAEYLIARNITDRRHLAIRGLSNGGLLVGACLAQRPDLYAAVISELPLLDALSMGRDPWSAAIGPELGNPFEDADAFDTIARYSPLQNLKDDADYPPTLVVAADKDSQLLMDGARKFTATLQAVPRARGPHLLHILRNAGHGGWSKSQQIDTAAREVAFLLDTMGLECAFLRSPGGST